MYDAGVVHGFSALGSDVAVGAWVDVTGGGGREGVVEGQVGGHRPVLLKLSVFSNFGDLNAEVVL